MRAGAEVIILSEIAQAALPVIHLNGTSKQELGREAREALEALRVLREKLDDVTVHQRDFYAQADGSDKFRSARNGFVLSNAALAAIEEHLLRRLEIVAGAR